MNTNNSKYFYSIDTSSSKWLDLANEFELKMQDTLESIQDKQAASLLVALIDSHAYLLDSYLALYQNLANLDLKSKTFNHDLKNLLVYFVTRINNYQDLLNSLLDSLDQFESTNDYLNSYVDPEFSSVLDLMINELYVTANLAAGFKRFDEFTMPDLIYVTQSLSKLLGQQNLLLWQTFTPRDLAIMPRFTSKFNQALSQYYSNLS